MEADKKKGIAAMIVAKMAPKADEKDADGDMDVGQEDEYTEGQQQAADEVMQAMKTDDPKSFATALKNFIDMCK